MTPSEKHLETAHELMIVAGAEYFNTYYDKNEPGELYENGLVVSIAPHIAAALAQAERDGMKRAAEIARRPVVFGNQSAIEACADFIEAWEMGTDDAVDGIVKCILSEAGEE